MRSLKKKVGRGSQRWDKTHGGTVFSSVVFCLTLCVCFGSGRTKVICGMKECRCVETCKGREVE